MIDNQREEADEEYELAYCPTCNQMTNHLGGECMKHIPKEDA